MSVLVAFAMPADTATFEKALTERAAEFDAIEAQAREYGALSHRFGLGDGFIQVVDEWESSAGFEQFFSRPQLQRFITEIGGDTSAQPQIWISAVTDLGKF
jgi:quinol monooxygenase YgiN